MSIFQKRSVFDMSHDRKFSCDMGKLVPILCEEVLPGDTFKVKTDLVLRLAPMLAPMMHRVDVFTHYFYVPTRILHDNWENFITGGKNGQDATPVPIVRSPAGGFSPGSLWDYFGLPTGIGNLEVLAYPFRAYALIYNDWYRDQNLQDPVGLSLADGLDQTTNLLLLNRNWEKDYFTSALPWPQRGDSPMLPLAGSEAPVSGNLPGRPVIFEAQTANNVYQARTLNPGPNTPYNVVANGAGDVGRAGRFRSENANLPEGNLIADLSEAGSVSINDLRLAFQVQRWMERSARGGARLVETILSHFGVRSSDARLQRPEYLGGGKSPLVISEVLQTSSTDATSPQGNMAGHGFSAHRSHEFNKSFEEHGYVIGLVSIMPRTAYQQGVPRQWNRRSRYDWYWPAFAHLGEQAVLNKELYAQGTSSDLEVFGYQGRYDEYRRRESTVHGDFRSSLDFWHMGRIFASPPALNSQFVTADPTKRISAVTDDHNCWVQLLNQVQAIRPLPKRGVPGFIDQN